MAIAIDVDAVGRHIEQHLDDHLEQLRRWVRQPSVSAENHGVREMAGLVADDLRRLGCRDVALVETSGHPGVFGFLDAGAERTLVVYFMYDVQPVTGEKWRVDPYAGAVVPMDPFPRVLMARGAINSKGPQRAFLNAIESILATHDRLPVNIVFTCEGEEELGSPHFREVLEPYAEQLRRAAGSYYPSAGQDRKGDVQMSLGNKGIVYLELECSGERWRRGPTADHIHSSMKAVVDSPVWRLVQALASMTSEDGNTVTIDGFYDKVRPASAEDRELVDALAKRWTPDSWRQTMKIERFVDDLDGRALLDRYFFSTTLNIDGFWAGWTGPGSKTILPSRAAAKLDVRLVPDQEAEDIVPLIRRHLDSRGYRDIEIRQLDGYTWSKTSARTPLAQALLKMYRARGIEPLVFPHMGGSAPMYLYTKWLGLPHVSGGLGHGGRAHAPDEYYVIEGDGKVAGLAEAERSYAEILFALADG
jgi:acetylornithine deacetylase/succinyl-diaminopimelate desuccinylase-like protein